MASFSIVTRSDPSGSFRAGSAPRALAQAVSFGSRTLIWGLRHHGAITFQFLDVGRPDVWAVEEAQELGDGRWYRLTRSRRTIALP